MAFSYVTYESDGSTKEYSIPFEYLDKDHVHVSANNEEKSFTWINDGLISLDFVPSSGTFIVIYRETPIDELYVDFQDTAYLTEDDLEQSTKHTLMALQESRDAKEYTLRFTKTNPSKLVISEPIEKRTNKLLGFDKNGDIQLLDGINTLLEYRNEAKTFRDETEDLKDKTKIFRDDAESYASDADELVKSAEAGFDGFGDGNAYDFGYIKTETTYFDQDWGFITS